MFLSACLICQPNGDVTGVELSLFLNVCFSVHSGEECSQRRERKRSGYPSAAACTRCKINLLLFLSPAVFLNEIYHQICCFAMDSWKKMAEFVGKKLVDNCQERILQRIYDGVNSNFVLDISDFKESDSHKLLHLVWRKYPRNRPPMDGQKSIISHSTQTEGVSGPGLNKIPKNSSISDTDSLSASDMRGLFDGKESASISDAGWTSDCSTSSSDLVAQETSRFGGPSFKLPAKGRASKPKIFKPKTWTKLTNRFKCIEENTPEHDDISRETGRKSPLLGSPPKTELKSKKSKIPKTPSTKSSDSPSMSLSYETQLHQFKDSINTSNKLSPEYVPSDMLTMSPSGIPGVGGSPSPPPIPSVAAAASASDFMKSVSEHKSTPENKFLNAPTSPGPNPPVNVRRKGEVKWFDPSILRYGFIVMEGCNKDVFFHVNDVHSVAELKLTEGDEVSFIFNEYGPRGTDVQFWTSFLDKEIERRKKEIEKLKYKIKQSDLESEKMESTL